MLGADLAAVLLGGATVVNPGGPAGKSSVATVGFSASELESLLESSSSSESLFCFSNSLSSSLTGVRSLSADNRATFLAARILPGVARLLHRLPKEAVSWSVELLVSAEANDIESVSSIGWLFGMLTLVGSKELVGLCAEQFPIAGLVGDIGAFVHG